MMRSLPIKGMTLAFALACALGLAFNRSNPLGIRDEEPPADTAIASSAAANRGSQRTARLSAPAEGASEKSVASDSPGAPSAAAETHSASTIPAVPSASASSPSGSLPALPEVGSITWAQAKEQLHDGVTVIVDARAPSYYEAGHIPDAVSMPPTSGALEFAAFVGKYPPQTSRVIIYCGTEACGLSKALASRLINDFGYTDVKVMPGGYAEYQAEAARKSAGQK